MSRRGWGWTCYGGAWLLWAGWTVGLLPGVAFVGIVVLCILFAVLELG